MSRNKNFGLGENSGLKMGNFSWSTELPGKYYKKPAKKQQILPKKSVAVTRCWMTAKKTKRMANKDGENDSGVLVMSFSSATIRKPSFQLASDAVCVMAVAPPSVMARAPVRCSPWTASMT